jgi:hypothetical protein
MISPIQRLYRNILAKTAVAVALCSLIPTASAIGEQADGATATIVFVRHGEKPESGLGQLNCRGLNRALALAPIIAKSFGRPDAIFAPNPSHPKEDAGRLYDYIRPLATIEPTAIWFGLPVDVSLDFQDGKGLQAALENRRMSDHNVFVLVAWEHRQIAPIVRALLAAHGDRCGDGEKGQGLGSQRFRQHVRRNDQRNKGDLRSKA